MKKMGNEQNTLVLLNSYYQSFSKAEKKVADTVIGNPENAVYYSVTDLAQKANVGETSVIRFCRKLGFRGFQDFKLSLAQDLVTPSQQVYGQIDESDDIATICGKMTSHNTQILEDTRTLLSSDSLEKAAMAMVSARKLHFFGVGSSGFTASDAKYRFMRLGFHTECATDSHIIAMNCALTSPGDVVVGISSSGSTKDLVDAMRIAKKNGAFIICLTSHARSPITMYADVILLTAIRENPLQGGAFSSKIAQLHALDILTTIVAVKRKDFTFSALKTTAEAVLDKMY